MSAGGVNHNLWSLEDLAAARVPDCTKLFLTTVGLPTYVSGLLAEFGVYDSELPYLVIGTEGDSPVVVNEQGCVLQLSEDLRDEWHLNSSVEHLSRCCAILEDFMSREPSDEADPKREVQGLRERLREIDPGAVSDAPKRLWAAMLDHMEALG